MRLRDAYEKASEFNRKQEANGSQKRFVVVSKPIGSFDGDYQLISRRVGTTSQRRDTTR